MNTIRKIRKNTKALSPVVASIILIAVTVAVSIAVAAWMGALSVGFMQTEQLSITNVQYDSAYNPPSLVLSVRNTGTANITITSVVINGAEVSAFTSQVSESNKQGTIYVPFTPAPGASYQIKLLSAKGTWFPYNWVAP